MQRDWRSPSWRKYARARPAAARPGGIAPSGNRLGLGFESLEQRLLLTVPAVSSINRLTPPGQDTAMSQVTYRVIFSEAVANVDAADFQVISAGSVQFDPALIVQGSGVFYTVKVDGLQGSGTIRLDLVDDDSIESGTAVPLGGAGLSNGSFQGQTYTILQAAPFVQSIVRAGAATLPLGATSAEYSVTFSEPVTGVDPSDFTLVLGGGLGVTDPLAVAGGGSSYTITVSGITGNGTLGLNLTDDRSIVDDDGNRLISASGSLTFVPQAVVPAGAVPISVVGADLNADNLPDLVVSNFFDANLSVMLGNGDGTFQTQVTYATGDDPNSVVARDVNGDGKPDLVAVNFLDATVSVLLGNGDGTFQTQVVYATQVNPTSVAVADVSRDGKPDLVVANRGSNSVSVLIGNGDGTFQAQVPYAVGTSPQSVTVADVNFDGKFDLIVANSGSNNVSVLLGNGSGAGTFAPHTTYATLTNPQSAAVADVNMDGHRDLIVANFGGNSASVLLGNGTGTFASQVAWPTGMQPQAVVAADMNLDGKIDLVVANSNDNNVGVLLGIGDGTFQAQSNVAVGAGPASVAPLDLDADGRPDLVTANLFGGGASVRLGNSNGNHTGEVYTVLPTAVVQRALFYLGSPAFDVTNMMQPGFSHDNAIAPDKWAYLPGGGVAVFNNVSSYVRGINGIMIDLLGPGAHASIGFNDFVFKVGNNNTPTSWSPAPTPGAISVRAGAGTSGADRVEITWASGAIVNSWLEVQVLPTAATGLTSTDVFFWGSKVGDIGGPTATEFSTTGVGDVSAIVAGGFGPASGITDPRDIDRDKIITASGDRNAAAANIGAITRIDIGAGGPFVPGAISLNIASAAAARATGAIPLAADSVVVVPRPREPAKSNGSVDTLRDRELAIDREWEATATVLSGESLAVEPLDLDDELLDALVRGTLGVA